MQFFTIISDALWLTFAQRLAFLLHSFFVPSKVTQWSTFIISPWLSSWHLTLSNSLTSTQATKIHLLTMPTKRYLMAWDAYEEVEFDNEVRWLSDNRWNDLTLSHYLILILILSVPPSIILVVNTKHDTLWRDAAVWRKKGETAVAIRWWSHAMAIVKATTIGSGEHCSSHGIFWSHDIWRWMEKPWSPSDDGAMIFVKAMLMGVGESHGRQLMIELLHSSKPSDV